MYGEIAYKYGYITYMINMYGEIVHKCGHINIHKDMGNRVKSSDT